jgi:hypothetical protein
MAKDVIMREIGPKMGEGVTRRARGLGLAVAANTIASGMEHAFLETEALKVMPRLIEEPGEISCIFQLGGFCCAHDSVWLPQ